MPASTRRCIGRRRVACMSELQRDICAERVPFDRLRKRAMEAFGARMLLQGVSCCAA